MGDDSSRHLIFSFRSSSVSVRYEIVDGTKTFSDRNWNHWITYVLVLVCDVKRCGSEMSQGHFVTKLLLHIRWWSNRVRRSIRNDIDSIHFIHEYFIRISANLRMTRRYTIYTRIAPDDPMKRWTYLQEIDGFARVHRWKGPRTFHH